MKKIIVAFHALLLTTAKAFFAELPSGSQSLPEIKRDETIGFCHRDLSKLKQVIVVFRHGDSTPDGSFPSDTHQEDSWPTGFAQLTQRGVERSYELGKFMRTCYGSFLNKIASPKRVYARSSDTDQTLMSAQAHLAGAYPPSNGFQVGYQTWGETSGTAVGQMWQPFPVHTVDDFADSLLFGQKNCPRYDELAKEINFDEKTTERIFKDLDFLKMLSRKACLITNDLLYSAQILQKTVLAQIENGRTPVSWLADERVLEKLVGYRDLLVDLYGNHPEMAKLTGGSLLQEITNRLVLRSVGNTTLEHVIYSGHDIVLEGLLGSLGVLKALQNRKPPYGAAVIFELHRPDPNSFSVMAFYRNSSTADPIPLEIPGCDSSFEKIGCSLDEFTKALSGKMSRSHDADCTPKRPQSQLTTTMAMLFDLNNNDLMSATTTRCVTNANKKHHVNFFPKNSSGGGSGGSKRIGGTVGGKHYSKAEINNRIY